MNKPVIRVSNKPTRSDAFAEVLRKLKTFLRRNKPRTLTFVENQGAGGYSIDVYATYRA